MPRITTVATSIVRPKAVEDSAFHVEVEGHVEHLGDGHPLLAGLGADPLGRLPA